MFRRAASTLINLRHLSTLKKTHRYPIIIRTSVKKNIRTNALDKTISPYTFSIQFSFYSPSQHPTHEIAFQLEHTRVKHVISRQITNLINI